MTDPPSDRALASALEAELRRLADEGPPELRLRLLVAAYVAGLLAAGQAHGDADDPELARALREGDLDDELGAVAASLRAGVAQRLRRPRD